MMDFWNGVVIYHCVRLIGARFRYASSGYMVALVMGRRVDEVYYRCKIFWYQKYSWKKLMEFLETSDMSINKFHRA